MLAKKDIDAIGTLTNTEIHRQWQGLTEKLSQGTKITVANTGLYNSGKSSLFNAILGRECFAVGAVPTTKTGDREMMTDNIELLDTPGIDTIDSRDDATAFDSLMRSDIILMTHNIKTGMLNRAEYEWLTRIAGGMSRESIPERLMFVSTWTDEIQDDTDREKLRGEIRRQVTEAVNGQTIRFAEVSAKRFKTGIETGQKVLENASGIHEFRELVINAAKGFAEKSESLRRQELLNLCRITREKLNSKKRELSSEIDMKKKRINDRYSGAFETWRGILSRFTGMRSNVQNKLNECKSISYDSYFESRIYDM